MATLAVPCTMPQFWHNVCLRFQQKLHFPTGMSLRVMKYIIMYTKKTAHIDTHTHAHTSARKLPKCSHTHLGNQQSQYVFGVIFSYCWYNLYLILVTYVPYARFLLVCKRNDVKYSRSFVYFYSVPCLTCE